jgi:hypothetical protein
MNHLKMMLILNKNQQYYHNSLNYRILEIILIILLIFIGRIWLKKKFKSQNNKSFNLKHKKKLLSIKEFSARVEKEVSSTIILVFQNNLLMSLQLNLKIVPLPKNFRNFNKILRHQLIILGK